MKRIKAVKSTAITCVSLLTLAFAFQANSAVAAEGNLSLGNRVIEEGKRGCLAKLGLAKPPSATFTIATSFQEPNSVDMLVEWEESLATFHQASLPDQHDVSVKIAGEEQEIGMGQTFDFYQGKKLKRAVHMSLNAEGQLRFANGFEEGDQFLIEAQNGLKILVPMDDADSIHSQLDICNDRLEKKLKAARAPSVKPGDGPQNASPKSNPGSWVQRRDYPSRALREEIEGVVRFSLSIDEYGLPTDCTITVSSGHAILDSAICKPLKRRATFYPARNEDDEATQGTWSSAINWSLPH